MNRLYSLLAVLAACVLVWAVGGMPSAQAQSSTPKASAQKASSTQASSDASYESILNDPFVRMQGKRGLDLLYDMEFEKANTIFNQINRRYPDHPVGPFLQGLNIWWEIMLDLPDTSHDDDFYDKMDEVIARSDRILDDDADDFDGTFFKGAALGFRGRLRSNRDDWWKASMDGKNAIGYVRDVANRAPENDDYAFGKGMYDYYAALIRERYPVARPLMVFFPDGNKERGLELLKRTADDGWYIQTEAAYFLLQIYYLYESDYRESRKYVTWLRTEHPDNPYFHNFEGRVYARWGRWQQAGEVFREVIKRHDAGQAGYNEHMAEIALYYMARERMVADDYDKALHYLARLEEYTYQDEGSNYRILGRLRQGMSFDALGKRDIAKHRYREVLNMDDYNGAHDLAKRYLKTPYDG